ncbi:MAG: class I SAM-dependent methyltransferase [bacterium]|nr:class I SAM-dependent methyltransferase [bacterium]
MLSREDKRSLRENIFRHLDGIVAAPTAYALYEKGVLEYLLTNKTASIDSICDEFNANKGYLNVALRVLCSQGWLKQSIDSDSTNYQITDDSTIAFSLAETYRDVVQLLKYSEQFHPRKFELEPFRMLEKIHQQFINNYGLKPENPQEERIQHQVLKHIEGIIVGPTIVHLGMSGMFHKYFMEASFKPEEFHSDAESFRKILDIFTDLNWFIKKNETYQFTEAGLFFAKKASAYGVTVSYIPTLRKLDELIFGNPRILWDQENSGPEIHVDRAMNVWGSGGAHSNYFKVIDEIIIDIFNQPIEDQPKGILDMGCGNGAFLTHLFEVIELKTERGKVLEDHPLFLVGADYNEAALKITRANLIKTDIWAKVVWGDIGRPDLLAKDLKENYGIALEDLLNVRTFLDHNRIWEEPKMDDIGNSRSTGAYAYRGEMIDNVKVENSLLEHFKKWSPFVQKFGLLVIELHTVSPELAAQNVGRTAATAYDATHGYSDQYIVEVGVFNKVAELAGLKPHPKHFKRFPDSDLATVTVNLLKGK